MITASISPASAIASSRSMPGRFRFLRGLAAVHDDVDQFGSVNDDRGANLFLLDL
jgi:hypothetical protein